MAKKQSGLGKGLDALFLDNSTTDGDQPLRLPITEIEPNREQPRKHFDDEALQELCDSIKIHGVIQPLVVRPISDGGYQLIAGERRWRASRMAGLTEVPVVIREMKENETMEIALIENLQREDLNPVEEALGYRALIDDFSLTQEEVAHRMGKSRSAVTNALRLLSLNDAELNALRKGMISAGHARALLSCESEETRQKLLLLAADGASVREIERMVNFAKGNKGGKKATAAKPNFYSEVELSLKNEIGRKVNIKPTGKGKGTITIEFYSDKELTEFAKKLAGE